MRSLVVGTVTALVVTLAPPAVRAQQELLESVKTKCKPDLDSFCSKVTPGEGRLLACLYAHGDKISAGCEWALYDAAVQLERAVNGLAFVANECRADAEKHCSGVTPGKGRVLDCLKKHAKDVSKRCNDAVAALGLDRK
jgi:hypothetical protein